MSTTTRSRYTGPVEVGMVFTAPDNNGALGYRRVKVIAELDDEMLVLEELASRIRYTTPGEIFKCPKKNLRIVFVPEGELPRRGDAFDEPMLFCPECFNPAERPGIAFDCDSFGHPSGEPCDNDIHRSIV